MMAQSSFLTQSQASQRIGRCKGREGEQSEGGCLGSELQGLMLMVVFACLPSRDDEMDGDWEPPMIRECSLCIQYR